MSTFRNLLQDISTGQFDEANASDTDKVVYQLYKENQVLYNFDVLVTTKNFTGYLTDIYDNTCGDIFEFILDITNINFEVAYAKVMETHGIPTLIIGDHTPEEEEG